MAKRLLKSHFELENVKKFILQQDLKQIKEIYLLHLSSGNSDATRFKTEIKKKLQDALFGYALNRSCYG